MASNFCKNVVKMQVVGALSGYLLTKSPFVNASIATSTTKTKKGTLLGCLLITSLVNQET
ncbi:hypothetical protein CWO07_06350 [Vibrio splendidus]|uniref:Uncharacterized protein n=1 Tax=Vibrio splendidus TaxID=29497 RepID=A0A2T5EYA7_VIBSP|nr:hypothetical protein BCS86_19180 [Vibrio splendidus]PTP38117.1 hypothetical protein CWO07_06350 [Vibrio splendidus]